MIRLPGSLQATARGKVRRASLNEAGAAGAKSFSIKTVPLADDMKMLLQQASNELT